MITIMQYQLKTIEWKIAILRKIPRRIVVKTTQDSHAGHPGEVAWGCCGLWHPLHCDNYVSFIHSFLHSFIHTFFHPFSCYLYFHFLMHSLTYSSFIYSIICSFIYSRPHPCIQQIFYEHFCARRSFYEYLLASISILDITGWRQWKLLRLQSLQNHPQPKKSCKGKKNYAGHLFLFHKDDTVIQAWSKGAMSRGQPTQGVVSTKASVQNWQKGEINGGKNGHESPTMKISPVTTLNRKVLEVTSSR